MAFIPESDWVYRGRKACGPDGAIAAAEIRRSLRHTALKGCEPEPVPQYLTRPDRFVSTHHAEVFANSRSWLGRIAEKPTHDFPAGGKGITEERRRLDPSPIITPQSMATITGSVRRAGPVVIPDDHLRAIWSDGRDALKRRFADHTAATPSPIHFQNKFEVLPPIKTGTKPIEGRSNTSLEQRPPQDLCIKGFTGLGNRADYSNAQRVRATGPPPGAVDFRDLKFYGERKPLYAQQETGGARRWADNRDLR